MNITLFYQNVTVLDYAYLDSHQGVIGNSLKVHVRFNGTTDEEGVVYDFGHAKKKVKEIIDRDCDHRLVVPKGHLIAGGEGRKSLHYRFGFQEEVLTYQAPDEAFCEIPSRAVTNANIKSYLENIIIEEMPPTVSSVELEFEAEELKDNPTVFHYTHGLKTHYGNCQRLFHGHRNKVDVFINNQYDENWGKKLAQDIFKGNIHFCLWENVVNKEEIIAVVGEKKPEGNFYELPQVEIEYDGKQGFFKGSLPGSACLFYAR